MIREMLDCTLRDGGYVNDWMFDTYTAKAIIDGLYKAGVRWIEIGLMGKPSQKKNQTLFSNFTEMEPLLKERKSDCHYAVMVTTSTSDKFEFPIRNEKTPEVIRIAFFKQEIEKTFSLANELKGKGYVVFLQPMATFMYGDEEIDWLVEKTNTLHPYALYMVDSFSTMCPMDVNEMKKKILSNLDKDILFGFHAHNNIQMAYANVREFLKEPKGRTLIADSSIYGMGRGAGNLPSELLMTFLNETFGNRYDVSIVLKLYENYLHEIYKEFNWGYSLPYFLTAVNRVNSAWGWYFMSKGIDNLSDLERALKLVPKEWAYTLKPAFGEQVLKEVIG